MYALTPPRSRRALALTYLSLQAVQTDWTLGRSVDRVAYHIPIIRNQFTRALGPLFGEMHDEIVRAFDDNIPKTKGKCPSRRIGAWLLVQPTHGPRAIVV